MFSESEKSFLINILSNLTIKPMQPDARLIVELVDSIREKLLPPASTPASTSDVNIDA